VWSLEESPNFADGFGQFPRSAFLNSIIGLLRAGSSAFVRENEAFPFATRSKTQVVLGFTARRVNSNRSGECGRGSAE
jgi:hypothetical protein